MNRLFTVIATAITYAEAVHTAATTQGQRSIYTGLPADATYAVPLQIGGTRPNIQVDTTTTDLVGNSVTGLVDNTTNGLVDNSTTGLVDNSVTGSVGDTTNALANTTTTTAVGDADAISLASVSCNQASLFNTGTTSVGSNLNTGFGSTNSNSFLCTQVGGIGSSNVGSCFCSNSNSNSNVGAIIGIGAISSNCGGGSGSGGIGTSPTTCNCAQINSSIFQLNLQVADLEQAVYTDLLTVINGITAQITVLNQRTQNLNTRLTQNELLIANLQAQVNQLSVGGGGSSGSSLQQTLATLAYIQQQGFIQISQRWRIGEIASFTPSFVIQDTISNNPPINAYEFLQGRGIRVFPVAGQ